MTAAGRTGLWLVGARGSLATTVTSGLALLAMGSQVTRDGLVTEQGALGELDLVPLTALVTGGHDVSHTPLAKRAAMLADGGVIPGAALAGIEVELDRADERVRHGYVVGEEPQRDAVARLAEDIAAFAASERLDRVVVVNVSSTEPPVVPSPAHADVASLEAAWDRGEDPLPPSAVYAAAAFSAGAAFIDFTPSAGARLPALGELAARAGVPFGGSDGKTGETLVKSVLAPMFAARALRVRSWSATNLLGGGDGATLADPEAMQSKAISKARGLEAMLGYPVEGPLHIDNVTDLGDWKTAWDHVTFSGFLGTRMTMQFTWQGCDSALAAPLVIDLARLGDLALRRGERGPLPALGFFFKDPVGSTEHQLFDQHRHLTEWATGSATS